LPVHFGLWDSAMRGTSWLEQIAIVNRYQEAGGVDSSLYLIRQLRDAGRDATATIMEKIHQEEIRHVAIGTTWWNWAFSHYKLVYRENISLGEEMGRYFFEIIGKHLPSAWKSRVPLDLDGRRKCGFSKFEMQTVEKLRNK